MGLRDIASAAIEAEEAKQKADEKRWWNENARAGESIVKDLLGITGKAVRAHKTERSESTGAQWGNGTVVELEEGVCVKVMHWIHNTTDRYGFVTGTETTRSLELCDREGLNLQATDGSSFYSPKFTTLAELGHALTKYDGQAADNKAERERRARAREAAEARLAANAR